jgi:hypothetical protein
MTLPIAESPCRRTSTIPQGSGAARLSVVTLAPVWIHEGALLFVTDISDNYRDSPYKGDWRGSMTDGPRLSRPSHTPSTALALPPSARSHVLSAPHFPGPSCPGRKSPFLAVKRPARPYKNTIQNRSTMGNAKGASPPREGPGREQRVADVELKRWKC